MLPSFQARRSTPTDVIIDLYADEDPGTPGLYTVTADITCEVGGASREVRVHFVRVRDGIPSGSQYGYCVRAHVSQTARIDPGQTTRTTQAFTISGADLTDIANGKFVVYCREPDAYPNGVVDQTAVIHYPFPEVPVEIPGDIDGDGDVDLADLQSLLAAYGYSVGDPEYKVAADIDEDGTVGLADLQILLANYGTT